MSRNKHIKVLMVSIDVSELSEEQIEELRVAMEAQAEVDYPEAPVLNSGIRLFDPVSMEEVEEDSGLH